MRLCSKKWFGVILTLFLFIGVAGSVFAADARGYSVNDYQKVISELNDEIGGEMVLPIDDSIAMQLIYLQTPEEFKASLLRSYKEAISSPSVITLDASPVAMPRAYHDLYQEQELDIGGCVYLESGVETSGSTSL